MVQHLKQLSASGVTHIELLPVFDLATVNEFSGQGRRYSAAVQPPVRGQ
ncbi:pullulanase [Klebsiella pneumoniae subsp. ozaenae]|uniref:Pullulanase n=1 Tax=Klebsiella pneumoniae subsp. ozaenae TaxID=574 RepID=A0A378C0T3_KLEPO|nr:pullulanase [Klebsiella pneumoniae subsp. ozaenae]